MLNYNNNNAYAKHLNVAHRAQIKQ